MYSPHRRKICELEMEKQSYIRHITRLQDLKRGRSPEHIRRDNDRRKLAQTINNMRKMHTSNRQFKLKEMSEVEKQFKKNHFAKVKSVVAHDFNWPMPLIAPKHQRNVRPIFQENMKILKRILHTKANIESQNLWYTQRKKQQILPFISSSDFSKLYQASQICDNEQKTIRFKLGKGRKFTKFKVLLNFPALYDELKDSDSNYVIEASYLGFKSRSPSFILGELTKWEILLKIGEKLSKKGQVFFKMIKILDSLQEKQICRTFLSLDLSAACQNNQYFGQIKNLIQQQGIKKVTPHICSRVKMGPSLSSRQKNLNITKKML